MNQIKLLFFLLLISCTPNKFDVMNGKGTSYTRKLAAEQHYISKEMFEIGNDKGEWGSKAILEIDETKRIIEQLYASIGNEAMFSKLKKKLLDNFMIIDIDEDINDLLYPDDAKLCLAELAIYLKYRGYARISLTQFDHINMLKFKTDTGYVIGIVGGRTSKKERPVITDTKGKIAKEFDNPLFITLSPEEASDLGGKAWLTFPTHLGDTSFIMRFK